MFTLQVVSNLFLDCSATSGNFRPRAPYLAIVGNLGPLASKETAKFLARISTEYKKIFIVPSPREHYFIPECPQPVRFFRDVKDIYFLDRQSFLTPKVEIIGVTQWPLRSNELGRLYKSVNPLTPWTDEDDVKEAERDMEYLISKLRNSQPDVSRILLSYAPPPHFYDIHGRVHIPEYWRGLLVEANVKHWVFGMPASFSHLKSSSTEIQGPDYRKSPTFNEVITL